MKTTIKRLWPLVLTLGPLMQAATASSVNVQTLKFNPGQRFIINYDALNSGQSEDVITIGHHYVNDPIVATDEARENRKYSVVKRITSLWLGASKELSENISVFGTTGFSRVKNRTFQEDWGLEDVRLGLKARIWSGEKSAISIIPELILPTGDKELFLSDDSFSPGIFISGERRFGRLHLTAAAGYRNAGNSEFQNIDYRHRLQGSVGAYYQLSKRWGLRAEAAGLIPLTGDSSNRPGEILGGIRFHNLEGLEADLNAGAGTLDRDTSTDIRVLGKLSWRFGRTKTKTKIVVKESPVKLRGKVLFAHDSAILTPMAKARLAEFALKIKDSMANDGAKYVFIIGNTNYLGKDKYNLTLSVRRAIAVRSFLVKKGIKRNQVKFRGDGEKKSRMDKDAIAYNRNATLEIE